ncbi:MAG: 4Fe-4S binding protein [Chitinophagales bacterium]|nr:4Fe-4S binding protein [Chitinophagales bacterium]
MGNSTNSLSIANSDGATLTARQRISLGLAVVGVFLIFLAWLSGNLFNTSNFLWPSLTLMTIGTLWFTYETYAHHPDGIKNNNLWFNSLTNRGTIGWITGILITAFYVCLYFFPSLLGYNPDGANISLIKMFDPISYMIKGEAASQWFVYGVLYTFAILIMGVKFIMKYRHNSYQIFRTISVMFFQFGFAFMLPEIMYTLNESLPYYDWKNMWPLNYYFFDSYNLDKMIDPGFKQSMDLSTIMNEKSGLIGLMMLVWGLLMIFVVSPILAFFFGKRWYCSWVCGCGGLAETAGDPFRHLSDKSLKAWKIERWMIHLVLVIVVIMTILTLYTYFSGSGKFLGVDTYWVRKVYGFLIGSIFAGVIGVGFYPLMGSRVWCRFGCPMAAILGIQQKYFSKFRITTNGSQCISCGNCSTYCEMGIDVRWYAQRGQDVVRASCVGCGICAAVCPRGVLKLENGPQDSRKLEMPEFTGIK